MDTMPTPSPTGSPTPLPTNGPTAGPTASPFAAPSTAPSIAPVLALLETPTTGQSSFGTEEDDSAKKSVYGSTGGDPHFIMFGGYKYDF